jgi:excisionase family DNA binding protein
MNNAVNPREAAQMLGVTTQTLRRYVDVGLLVAERTQGGHRRIDRASLEKLVASRNRISSTVTVIGMQ